MPARSVPWVSFTSKSTPGAYALTNVGPGGIKENPASKQAKHQRRWRFQGGGEAHHIALPPQESMAHGQSRHVAISAFGSLLELVLHGRQVGRAHRSSAVAVGAVHVAGEGVFAQAHG